MPWSTPFLTSLSIRGAYPATLPWWTTSLREQVEKHDSDYAMATQNKRQETKSFPPRVFLLNRSLDL
ncbi:hypothetical protein [Trichormus azollae]|uniref:hypothetical protein n=1 Tax=Trichormus azollae TaxID=1164 RepID=UPI00117C4D88|nr:hypothetical protein [Trichormus azollae]